MTANKMNTRFEVAKTVIARNNPQMGTREVEAAAEKMVAKMNRKAFADTAPDWTFDDSGVNQSVNVMIR